MKKVFFLLFVVCSISAFSQTWTEGYRYNEITRNYIVNVDYTALTRDQYTRLLDQYKTIYDLCHLVYTDVLENRPFYGGVVISGTRPSFNGYYRVLMTEYSVNFSDRTYLIYGNTNTGYMKLNFYKSSSREGVPSGTVRINSADFTRQYNQFLGWVNVQ